MSQNLQVGGVSGAALIHAGDGGRSDPLFPISCVMSINFCRHLDTDRADELDEPARNEGF